MLTTGRIMQWVIAATLPGLLALTLSSAGATS